MPFDHELKLSTVRAITTAPRLVTKGARGMLALPRSNRRAGSPSTALPTVPGWSPSHPRRDGTTETRPTTTRTRSLGSDVRGQSKTTRGVDRKFTSSARRKISWRQRHSRARCAATRPRVEGILTGADLDALDDDALAAAIPHTTVFARVSPDQKARIIKIARRTGVDVAYMGDGVNDAVALHAADGGISVESGGHIAKDAADIVLLDKELGVLADAEWKDGGSSLTPQVRADATSSNFGKVQRGGRVAVSTSCDAPSQIC